MKYLLGLLLIVILGALVWSGVVITPTAERGPVATTPSVVADSPQLPPAAAPGAVPPSVSEGTEPTIGGTATQVSVAPNTLVPSLLIPVQGVDANALTDTFNDARSQGRSHDAIDIMAPAGTPVLAVADGHVEKLFTSERGGLTIYQFEPTGRLAYYYAHLQAYAPNLAQKQSIKRGDILGYVGSTGNASPQAPHLHFAVFILGPEKRWWEGQAINPYPLLSGTAN